MAEAARQIDRIDTAPRWTQADADGIEPRLRHRRQQFRTCFEQIADAGDRRALVETRFLDGRADEQRAVVPRYKVAIRPPHHSRDQVRFKMEVKKLPTDRANRRS